MAFRWSILGLAVALACAESPPESEPAGNASAGRDTAGVRHDRLEVSAILAVTEAFFSALSLGDTAAISPLLAPGTTLHSVRERDSRQLLGMRSREEFLQELGSDRRDLLERVWNSTVMVEGRVAVVWAPYDFHVDGVFSHCGTDVVTLLKSDDGWIITGLTYDVVEEGCSPSPLGPPF